MINPNDGAVSMLLAGRSEKLIVLTENMQGSNAPMTAKRLRDIHIDHTPLMSNILSTNLANLPSLTFMSEIIKKSAKQNVLDIKPSNFGRISKHLFENKEIIEKQLIPLIPDLKKELQLLREQSTLKLMQATHNLRKK